MKNLTSLLLLIGFITFATSCSNSSSNKSFKVGQFEMPSETQEQTKVGEESFDGEDVSLTYKKRTNAYLHRASRDLKKVENPDPKYSYYMVRRNDSLMLISFEIYGTYKRWKQIKRLNPDVLVNGNELEEGMILKFIPPLRPYIRPSGHPYIIRKGDTLGIISHKVYSKQDNWKFIWQNNQAMIKDPNVIFIGFTLFYPNKRMVDAGQIQLNNGLDFSKYKLTRRDRRLIRESKVVKLQK